MADQPSRNTNFERAENGSKNANTSLSTTSSRSSEEGGESAKGQDKISSNVSESGSQRSDLLSPTLNPAQANAMNSSVISTLDLGEEPAFPTSSSFGNTLEGMDGSGANQIKQEDVENVPSDNLSSEELGRTYDGSALSSSLTNRSSNGYAPLAPRDVLATAPVQQPTSSLSSSQSFLSIPNSNSFSSSQRTLGPDNNSFNEGDQSGYSAAGTSVAGGAAQSGDDSALNALMEAHSKEPSSPHRPNKRDASFGLDPDVDTQHSLEGQPFRPHLLSSPLRPSTSSSGQHRHHDTHNHHHHSHGKDKSVYDKPEEQEFSHTSAATGAPHTMETGMENVQTVPTVSATGMPRFLPRRTSRSPSNDSLNEKRKSLRNRRSSSVSSSQVSAPEEMQPQYAPSGSLTIALFTPGLTWRRRSYLLLASMVINIGLPFINGIALGFGEILARGLIAPWIGLAPAALNINAPAAQRPGVSTTSGVGLRHAGIASANAPPADKGRNDAR